MGLVLGLNVFSIVSPVLIPGSTGPQAPIDLFTAVPPSGLDEKITFVCKGEFDGAIALEGSADGVTWDVLGQFTVGRDADAMSGPALELSPLVLRAVVRFLRLNVTPGSTIKSATVITVGAEQNCACEPVTPPEPDILSFSGHIIFEAPV